QLKIEPANRTLTISAQGQVTADPDVAILRIGFQTQPSDAKAAYAAGAKTSNDIVDALKQAGIPETAIHSEWQRLDRVFGTAHKFQLTQQWTVKTSPERAAEILDVAITAGATQSGDIDWTMQDMRALDNQALDRAAARAKSDAEALAKAMGVRLGALIYVTNQISAPQFLPRFHAMAMPQAVGAAAPQTLAIEPRKVSSEATVYAVFAIE
ncbi:MAG: SIMPL domain-containing protein, partial [Terracidiphilus sp.]